MQDAEIHLNGKCPINMMNKMHIKWLWENNRNARSRDRNRVVEVSRVIVLFSQVNVVVTLKTFILCELCLCLVQDTGYPDSEFLKFSSVHPGKCQDDISIRTQSHPSNFFLIDYSSVILQSYNPTVL
jgi:hypothetical protein